MLKNIVKSKNVKTAGMIALLAIVVLAIGMFGLGCTGSGLMPVGWSGGVVSDGIIYIGSLEGRLVSFNTDDQSILRAEPLKVQPQSGLLGCTSSLGCSGASTKVPIYGTPVVSDNIVYIAGYSGKLYAYNTYNLAQKWVFPSENYAEPFVGGMAVADGKIFIGCSDGFVYSLDAVTGATLKYFQTDDKIWGTPTVVGDTLYIGSFDKKFYALNTADLTPKWSFTTEGSIITQPLVSDGIVYFGSFDRKLYALNASDGSPAWQEPFMADNWFWSKPVIVNGTLYAGCLDGLVYVLGASTGAEVAQPLNIGSQVASQPAVFENYVIFASHEGGVYKINSDTQEIALITDYESPVDGPLTVYEGILYFQTQNAYLQRIDLQSGAILPSISLISQ